MFQARLPQGNLLKKLIDSIKDLVTEANFDVSEAGLQLQAMDTSHVCLLALMLRSDGFEEFRQVYRRLWRMWVQQDSNRKGC